MKFILLVIVVISVLLISGCGTGYKRKNGNWCWVTNDEYNGSRINVIPEADDASFEVLSNKQFARDRFNIYFEGRKVISARPEKVVFMGDDKSCYFKDDAHVFFRTEVVRNADPNSFEVLEFPYSKDKNDVYCGTVPMMLGKEDVASFKVTNEDELMKGMITTTRLNHFIEYNQKYKWLDTLLPEIENVITGEWGTGEANGKKYKGLYEVTSGGKIVR